MSDTVDHADQSPVAHSGADPETELGRALLLAQEVADEMTAQARAEAARLLHSARRDAEVLRTEAEADAAARLAEAETEARNRLAEADARLARAEALIRDVQCESSSREDGPSEPLTMKALHRRLDAVEARADAGERRMSHLLSQMPTWIRDLEDQVSRDIDLAARQLDAARAIVAGELRRMEAVVAREVGRCRDGGGLDDTRRPVNDDSEGADLEVDLDMPLPAADDGYFESLREALSRPDGRNAIDGRPLAEWDGLTSDTEGPARRRFLGLRARP